jgi:uncharacterized membrane protein
MSVAHCNLLSGDIRTSPCHICAMIVMILFLLVALAVAGVALVLSRIGAVERELERIDRRIAGIEARLGQAGEPAPEIPAAAAPPPAPPATIAPPLRMQRELPAFSLEALIGGRLPIWIGGAALVLAGFFLVRFSIERGLLGPSARTILAAVFAAVLIVVSEVTRRLPATRDDPRVAQAFAGAGTASFYGTLYIAATLYQLVGPPVAFALMIAVTGMAMALSLRHGPPTAIMALAGGFAAPLVAGFDAAGIGPLLVYLALFTAALFGLAVHRGWGWLALAAAAVGFVWINFLIVALPGRDLSGVGAFVVLLAAGASAALPATGIADRWLRLAPLVAGLVQLIALAPYLDFSPLAWGLYLILAAAALFLAWRDERYLPGALAALALLLVLEGIALVQPAPGVAPAVAIAATLIFAAPGHLFARRGDGWAALALAGTVGPLLVAHASSPSLLSLHGWGALELAAAAASAGLAWRLRTRDPRALLAATIFAATVASIGLAQFFTQDWLAMPLALVALALAGWARLLERPTVAELPALPLAAALLLAVEPLGALLALIAFSVGGDRLPYNLLPDLAELGRSLLVPTLAAVALLTLDSGALGRTRRGAVAATIALGILLLYALAKQPLAIATIEAFVALGFVERALITQAFLAAGWLLLRRDRASKTGQTLFAIGLFRAVWFDLLMVDPALVPQSVGALPLFNAAVLHAALVAAWLWTLGQRSPAFAATFVTVLAAVRQAAHGDILTGSIDTSENGGYSAALLALALVWLWCGIAGGARDLRVAGLALLTLVTLKVFLIDAAALDGVLRILSFLGLGLALIGIGWAYGRFVKPAEAPVT